eukprot:CAMPEP_0204823554 /NCGR_PEP_ID=MMETSP1346-20131115/1622_1 /ASSEMBLY_ACC=CAM_ASM_000771 /TAXON_ID=215587 /ORGANISM="Aplanochytrium stocchinoi, Strain GSBS06" /LENGTH=226 /DNA_ID=CAMNT_0051950237 /DNA_START=462 /DNA_END=1142 /DNA_ORIENTATION=+
MMFTDTLSFESEKLRLEQVGLDVKYMKIVIEMVPFMLAAVFAYAAQARKEESYWEPHISEEIFKKMNLSHCENEKRDSENTFDEIKYVDEEEVEEEGDDDDKALISDSNPVNLIKAITKSDEHEVKSEKEVQKEAKTPQIKVRRSSRRQGNTNEIEDEEDDQENRQHQQKVLVMATKEKKVSVPDALSPNKKQSATLVNAREEAARMQRERTEQRIRELRQRRTKK